MRRSSGNVLPSDRHLFREETDDPLYADKRNFYKVEKWTRDGTKVDSLLYAGNSLEKASDPFLPKPSNVGQGSY
jgi:hypothetical protein